jgi:hypothetical protein
VKRIGESLLQRGTLGRDADRSVRSRPRSAVDVVSVVGGDGVGVLEDMPSQECDCGFVRPDNAVPDEATEAGERGC